MSFTKTHLPDVEDSAAQHGFGDIQAVRFAQGTLDAEQTGISHHTLKPGRRQPFGHRHEAAEEIYVVLSGSGRARLDDETVDLAPLDALRIAPGVMRRLEAGPDGMTFLAFGPRHEGDGEIDQEFWAG